MKTDLDHLDKPLGESCAPSLEAKLLHILQHSLGLDQYGEGTQYRNHFVAGGDDVGRCRQLVARGYMVERTGGSLSGDSPVFHVTPVGIDAVALLSPEPPKLTRSQQRYRDYQEVSECFDSFLHYLRYCSSKERNQA